MSTYQELKGLKVKYLSSDTSGDRAIEGEVFYNSTSGTVASHIASAAWSSTSILGTARRNGAAAAASNSAGLVFAGQLSGAAPLTDTSLEWDGSSWTEVANLNTARLLAGFGATSTAAIAAGGYISTGAVASVESWNNTEVMITNNLFHIFIVFKRNTLFSVKKSESFRRRIVPQYNLIRLNRLVENPLYLFF